MAEYRLGQVEMQFAELIWANEPISSGELVKLSADRLSWKKSTTHTVLRRICERAFFRIRTARLLHWSARSISLQAKAKSLFKKRSAVLCPVFLQPLHPGKRCRKKKLKKY